MAEKSGFLDRRARRLHAGAGGQARADASKFPHQRVRSAHRGASIGRKRRPGQLLCSGRFRAPRPYARGAGSGFDHRREALLARPPVARATAADPAS